MIALLPCLLHSQEEDDFEITIGTNESWWAALEDAYSTKEQWVMFFAPTLGEVRISNQGYISTRDSTGNTVVENIDCNAYPIVSEVMHMVFSQKYYWFSQKHFDLNKDLQDKEALSGGKTTYFSTINGEEYTFQASPEYILSTYRKTFPDVVLVAKLPDGEGVIAHHN